MNKWLRYGERTLWILLLAFIVLNGSILWVQLWQALRQEVLYWDFSCYYIAANLLDEHSTALYQLEPFQTLSQRLGLKPICPYFRYPPLFAWLLRPLGRLPYSDAVTLWTGLNGALLLILAMAGVFWLKRELPRVRWLIPTLLLAPPVVDTLILGQVNPLLLLFLLPTVFTHTSRTTSGQMLRGIGIALAAHLKPVWALLGLFELVRKRFWSAAAAVLFTLLLWGVEIALLGPGVLPDYLQSLLTGHQIDGLVLTGLDGSLWGAAAAIFGLEVPALPENWPISTDMIFQPLLGPLPLLSSLIPLLAGLWLIWRSLRPAPTDDLWDRRTLLAVVVVMTATPHSGYHAVILFSPALLFLAQRASSLRRWQWLALWWTLATLMPTSLWRWANESLWPLALTALPLLAGRLLLWTLILTAPDYPDHVLRAETGWPASPLDMTSNSSYLTAHGRSQGASQFAAGGKVKTARSYEAP